MNRCAKFARTRCLAVTLLLTAGGNAHALMAGNAPDSPEQRIDANTTSSPWTGVGSLSVNGGTFSGVVIGPRHVLTAAHVVKGAAPEKIVFNLNYGANLSHRIPASAVFVHPDYTGFDKHDITRDDIAVVELGAEVTEGVAIYDLNTAPPRPGLILTLVGYGASGSGTQGVTVGSNPAVKRTGKNAVDGVVADDEGSGALEAYLYDFDGPEESANGGPATLGNDIETTVGNGDSGSPAFIASHGRWLLAGINTFQLGANAPKFGSLGGGMLISAYAEWIQGILHPPAKVITTNHLPAAP